MSILWKELLSEAAKQNQNSVGTFLSKSIKRFISDGIQETESSIQLVRDCGDKSKASILEKDLIEKKHQFNDVLGVLQNQHESQVKNIQNLRERIKNMDSLESFATTTAYEFEKAYNKVHREEEEVSLNNFLNMIKNKTITQSDNQISIDDFCDNLKTEVMKRIEDFDQGKFVKAQEMTQKMASN